MNSEHPEKHFEEGEETAPRGVRAMAILRWVLLLLAFAAALSSVVSYAAPKLSADHGEHSGDAKYYCPMHPQITSDIPGECPICHMTLEPIPEERNKGRAPSTPASAPHAGHGPSAPVSSAMASSAPATANPASSASAPAAPSALPRGTAPIELSLDRVQAINVRTALVEAGGGTGSLRVPAVVEAPEQSLAEVRVRAPGYVERLRVKEIGVKVRAGQELVSFYSPEILQAQQELLAVRTWSSSNDGTSVPPARRRLELLGVSGWTLDRIVRTGKTTRTVSVTAPIAGHIVKKNVVLGSFVSPETVLFEIADLRKVYIIASVYSHQLASIAVGDPARFTAPSAASRVYAAKVDLIYPEVDLTTRTTRVRFQLENEDLSLLPGQIGTAEFSSARARQLTIPLDALIDTGTARYVFLAQPGGRFTPRTVEVADQASGRWVVVSGLSEGDRVVSGAAFLIDAESRLQASLAGSPP